MATVKKTHMKKVTQSYLSDALIKNLLLTLCCSSSLTLAQNLVTPSSEVLNPMSLRLNGVVTEIPVQDPTNTLLLLQTTRGDVVIELFPREAPEQVQALLALIADNHYAGLELAPANDQLTLTTKSLQASLPALSSEINAVALGLHQIPVFDEEGKPLPFLGINTQEDFQSRVLLPLYQSMHIRDQDTLETKSSEVRTRLSQMTLRDFYELWGYRYQEQVRTHAATQGTISFSTTGPLNYSGALNILTTDAPWLNGRLTILGKVRAGMPILTQIIENSSGYMVEPVTILAFSQVIQTNL